MKPRDRQGYRLAREGTKGRLDVRAGRPPLARIADE
jgi:hypothetical protein